MEIFNLGSLDDELPRARLALLLERFSELSDDRDSSPAIGRWSPRLASPGRHRPTRFAGKVS